MRPLLLLAFACWSLAAQDPDPARDPLNQALAALREGNESRAVALLEQARTLSPEKASLHKQLGYLYLKAGQTEQAVEAFERVIALDPSDPAATLQLAYLFRAQDRFDRAAALFRQALALDPSRGDVGKELAYLLLRMGETEPARELFAQLVEASPRDHASGLELAFLDYETGRRSQALRRFRSLEQSDDRDVAAKAGETAARLTAELNEAVERWERAVERDPDNRSARLEIARLYERRLEPADAAEQFLAAWHSVEGANREEILLSLAGARAEAGDPSGAVGAWLLASRSAETRIAEIAREKLPNRFPFASEFRAALALAPDDHGLRLELAYLLLEVGMREEAIVEFETIVRADPGNFQAAAQLAYLYLEQARALDAVTLLEAVRPNADAKILASVGVAVTEAREAAARQHRTLGEKSLQLSYLGDARRELSRAWDLDPSDYASALKLGVVYNLMNEDREALRWFERAASSPDPRIAEQADRSYRNLAPQFRRFTGVVWLFPFFSSRFNTAFGYAQVKGELRLDKVPIRPYVSLRLAGDVRGSTGGTAPQYLSEGSLIPALGLRAPLKRGLTLWGEAGASVAYASKLAPGQARARGDFRGGLNFFRSGGASLGGDEPGRFWETNLDAVYISRFDDNVIGYWQFRPGYRLKNLGWLKSQVYMNLNLTADIKHQPWASYAEIGPGFRFLMPSAKPLMSFFVDLVRGVHLTNRNNPRRPNYWDMRAGIWYSFGF